MNQPFRNFAISATTADLGKEFVDPGNSQFLSKFEVFSSIRSKKYSWVKKN